MGALYQSFRNYCIRQQQVNLLYTSAQKRSQLIVYAELPSLIGITPPTRMRRSDRSLEPHLLGNKKPRTLVLQGRGFKSGCIYHFNLPGIEHLSGQLYKNVLGGKNPRPRIAPLGPARSVHKGADARQIHPHGLSSSSSDRTSLRPHP